MPPNPALTFEQIGARTSIVDECFEWQGARTNKGYGQVRNAGKRVYVHRLVWSLVNGPIPDGLHVLHRCDNPPCVNPEHLWVGTNLDNARDCAEKGRQNIQRGEASGRHVLTASDVAIIRQSDEPIGVLAMRYGVTDAAISHASLGRSWRHLATPPRRSRYKRR